MLWDAYCLIRLSVIYRGRAVPLVWSELMQELWTQARIGGQRPIFGQPLGETPGA